MPNASAAQAAEAFGSIYRFKKRGWEKANELKLRAAKRAEAGFRLNLCAAHGTEFTGRFRFWSGFAIADGSFFIGQRKNHRFASRLLSLTAGAEGRLSGYFGLCRLRRCSFAAGARGRGSFRRNLFITSLSRISPESSFARKYSPILRVIAEMLRSSAAILELSLPVSMAFSAFSVVAFAKLAVFSVAVFAKSFILSKSAIKIAPFVFLL